MFKDLQLVVLIAEVLTAVAISLLYIRSRTPKEVIEQQKDLIDALRSRVELLETESKERQKEHMENLQEIAKLQGQLDMYKELPLKEIAQNLKQFGEMQMEILKAVKQIKGE